MFWVIQSNLYKEYGYQVLMDTLVEFDIPHVVVKPIPIVERLVPVDFDSFNFNGTNKEMPEPVINETGLVMVCGSLTLANIAKKRGWVPGSFNNENFTFEKWDEHYGERLLNHGSKVCKFKDVGPFWNEFFIRPCEDTKVFTGYVTSYIEFDIWRKDLMSVENDLWHLNGDTMVTVAPLKEIYNENRFFVVDGRIITYSQYKLGNLVLHNANIDSDIIIFAEEMIRIWKPSRAYVMDIARTSGGLKIIEFNCFNSSGFYACNIQKIVEAVESMKF